MVYCYKLGRLNMIHYIALLISLYDVRLSIPTYLSAFVNLLLKKTSALLIELYPELVHVLGRPLARPLARPSTGEAGEAGMPSGHCQVYWTFIMSVMLNYKLGVLLKVMFCVLGMMLGRERVDSQKHTALQVGVGSALGVACALYIHSLHL